MGNKFRKFTISGGSSADKDGKSKENVETKNVSPKKEKPEDRNLMTQNDLEKESKNKTDTGQDNTNKEDTVNNIDSSIDSKAIQKLNIDNEVNQSESEIKEGKDAVPQVKVEEVSPTSAVITLTKIENIQF